MPVTALLKDVEAAGVQTSSSVLNIPLCTALPPSPHSPSRPSNGLKPLSHSCRSAILSTSACLHVVPPCEEMTGLSRRRDAFGPFVLPRQRPVSSQWADAALPLAPAALLFAPLRSPGTCSNLALALPNRRFLPNVLSQQLDFFLAPPNPSRPSPSSASIAKQPTLLPSFLGSHGAASF